MKTKVNGVWKDGIPKVKVGGVWKLASSVWTKVSGAWKRQQFLSRGSVRLDKSTVGTVVSYKLVNTAINWKPGETDPHDLSKVDITVKYDTSKPAGLRYSYNIGVSFLHSSTAQAFWEGAHGSLHPFLIVEGHDIIQAPFTTGYVSGNTAYMSTTETPEGSEDAYKLYQAVLNEDTGNGEAYVDFDIYVVE